MSPTLIIGLVWAASVAVVGYQAFGLGRDHEIASQAKLDKYVVDSAAAAASAAAGEIAKMKITQTTIRQEVQREVRTNTVYVECQHPDGQLQRINAALAGAEPARDRELPKGASAPGR